MSNLLSAELYKMKKDLNFRLMAALTVIFTLIQYGVNAITEVVLRRGGTVGEQADLLERLEDISILDMLHGMFANTNAIIFVTIFVCCFVINDYSSGMVTNFVGKGYKRMEVFLAKFFVVQFGAVLLYLLVAMETLVIGIIFHGTAELGSAFFHDFVSYLALHILYLTAYTAVIILVCTIARNMAVGILISILGIMLFSNFIPQGIELILSYFGVEAGVSQYWIVTIIASCPVRDIPSKFLMSSGIATVFWLMVSMAAGLFWFEKRDIR